MVRICPPLLSISSSGRAQRVGTLPEHFQNTFPVTILQEEIPTVEDLEDLRHYERFLTQTQNVENSVTLLLGAEPLVKILHNKNHKKWLFFLLCLSVGENHPTGSTGPLTTSDRAEVRGSLIHSGVTVMIPVVTDQSAQDRRSFVRTHLPQARPRSTPSCRLAVPPSRPNRVLILVRTRFLSAGQ